MDAALKVTPEGQVTQVGTMYNSSLYPPRDISPIAARSSFQWALGRFFSNHIEKITRVEDAADGRLHVSASGHRFRGDNGNWELEIEPAAAWMVRKARFRPESRPEQIRAEMSNEGTVWSGSFCIPMEARVNFFGPIEDMETVRKTMTQHVTFQPDVGNFDGPFYDRCRQVVLHNKQPNLTVTDERVSPPSITQPNLPPPPQALPAARKPFRGWLFIINLAVVIVLSTALAIRRWRTGGNGPKIG